MLRREEIEQVRAIAQEEINLAIKRAEDKMKADSVKVEPSVINPAAVEEEKKDEL